MRSLASGGPQWDGLLTRVFDLDRDENAFGPCGNGDSRAVDYATAYQDCVSPGLFLRAGTARDVRFAERLGTGAGTPWGAGEETDYVFRCLDAGRRFYYDAQMVVRHPDPYAGRLSWNQARRAFGHGCSEGHCLATHTLPKELLRMELRSPYLDAIASLRAGQLGRSCASLLNGVGTTHGYRAGGR